MGSGMGDIQVDISAMRVRLIEKGTWFKSWNLRLLG